MSLRVGVEGDVYRADLSYMDKSGDYNFVEIKTCSGGKPSYTKGQKITIPKMQQCVPVTPFGGNARKFWDVKTNGNLPKNIKGYKFRQIIVIPY